jgi:hypothetical protein
MLIAVMVVVLLLSIFLLSVITLNVVILNVVAPFKTFVFNVTNIVVEIYDVDKQATL